MFDRHSSGFAPSTGDQMTGSTPGRTRPRILGDRARCFANTYMSASLRNGEVDATNEEPEARTQCVLDATAIDTAKCAVRMRVDEMLAGRRRAMPTVSLFCQPFGSDRTHDHRLDRRVQRGFVSHLPDHGVFLDRRSVRLDSVAPAVSVNGSGEVGRQAGKPAALEHAAGCAAGGSLLHALTWRMGHPGCDDEFCCARGLSGPSRHAPRISQAVSVRPRPTRHAKGFPCCKS